MIWNAWKGRVTDDIHIANISEDQVDRLVEKFPDDLFFEAELTTDVSD